MKTRADEIELDEEKDFNKEV